MTGDGSYFVRSFDIHDVPSRRQLLGVGGSIVTGVVAGCLRRVAGRVPVVFVNDAEKERTLNVTVSAASTDEVLFLEDVRLRAGETRRFDGVLPGLTDCRAAVGRRRSSPVHTEFRTGLGASDWVLRVTALSEGEVDVTPGPEKNR
ncbi:hypothetical protein [Halospeciosus flavus]|uniref:Uncharacterized protein n=1 Tax=Halospeciosus flavus TaxID=3032283 RepID=A0ABD5Z7C8_9EURY|nr:hypothetical protein [Halospeciosus flavus]